MSARLLILLVTAMAACHVDPPSGPTGGAPAEAGPAEAGPDEAGPDRVESSEANAATPRGAPRAGPPRFWSWQRPLGRAADDPRVIEIVRAKTSGTPEAVADQMCEQILRRRLGPGDVCILPQNFGMGDGDPHGRRVGAAPALFGHWCDGLPHPPVPGSDLTCEPIALGGAVPRWWATPWMRHGTAEGRAWMERFVARYRYHQGRDTRVPAPARFHFDTEGGPTPERKGAVAAFAAMRRDPRWDAEPIPGHGGRTLAALYEAAGRPTVDAGRAFDHPTNRAWSVWYAGLCRQAMEGTMDEAAYRLVRATWPACLSSNFGRSARYDGAGDPPRLMRSNRRLWLAFAHDAFADIQAPVCYWAPPEHRTGDEPFAAATVRRARKTVDANIHSFGGPHWNVVPWIIALGNVTEHRGREHLMTPTVMRDMLTMMRSRGIDEFLLWSDESSQHPASWNAFVDVVDRVFAMAPEAAVVTAGAGTGDHERVRFARRDPLVVASRPAGDGEEETAVVRVAFGGSPPPTGTTGVEIVVEGASDRPGTALTVRLRDEETGADLEAGRVVIGPGPGIHVLVADADDRVVRDGRVTVELAFRHGEAFTVSIDAVQVIPLGPDASPPPPPTPTGGGRDAEGHGDE